MKILEQDGILKTTQFKTCEEHKLLTSISPLVLSYKAELLLQCCPAHAWYWPSCSKSLRVLDTNAKLCCSILLPRTPVKYSKSGEQTGRCDIQEMRIHTALPYIAFFLQCICQIAIGIREVGLQLNSTTIRVNSQINETLLIVDAGQVAMDNCMVWAKAQGS